MPETPDDDAPRYDIPLQELTGRHGYARSRAEGEPEPDDLDPGAPVAYVAEPMKDRPNMLTIEGMIVGIGNAASAAAKEGGEPAWTMKALLAAFLLPVVALLVAQVVRLF